MFIWIIVASLCHPLKSGGYACAASQQGGYHQDSKSCREEVKKIGGTCIKAIVINDKLMTLHHEVNNGTK